MRKLNATDRADLVHVYALYARVWNSAMLRNDHALMDTIEPLSAGIENVLLDFMPMESILSEIAERGLDQ